MIDYRKKWGIKLGYFLEFIIYLGDNIFLEYKSLGKF
jgi:hypothetical protein